MQNPFTTTFSKMPEYTYIATEQPEEILNNFAYDNPSESVYKITGVRGSGKTVILARIEDELRKGQYHSDGWCVCDLNPTRDILMQFASMLQKEGLAKDSKGFSSEQNEKFFDIGVEIELMLQMAQKKRKKFLIGIDEVSKSSEMIIFASEFGKWLRAGYPVYLVCTGLYENMRELSNVKNLTFFRRATTVQTAPLSTIKMSEMYKNKLNVDNETAKTMSKLTKGYAYAFQELGVLYFKKRPEETLEDIVASLKSELYAYSYEKIWEEMSEGDQLMTKILTDKEEYKREEVLKCMGERSNNYSVYRDRLLKKGIIFSRQGYISLALPFFADYVKEYCI